MAKENKTKFALLGVLGLGPASGYDIKKFCDASIAHFWNENYGHIYPVLRQMETDGWVTCEPEMANGKTRNVYHLTETGKKAYQDWLSVPPESSPARYEFLLKMFFSKDIPMEDVIARLVRSKENCLILRQTYEALATRMESALEKGLCEERGLRFQYATVRYGILDVQAKIDWCEECIRLFQSETITEKGGAT